MSENLFTQLRRLMPEVPILVGLVIEIHDDDTSTVQLPGPDQKEYSGNIFTGGYIYPRGRQVPVGHRAIVRQWLSGWVIENEAPDGPIEEISVGTVVAPIPEPPVYTPPVVVAGPLWTVNGYDGVVDSSYIHTGGWHATRVVQRGTSGHATLEATTNPTASTWNFPTLPVDLFIKRYTGGAFQANLSKLFDFYFSFTFLPDPVNIPPVDTDIQFDMWIPMDILLSKSLTNVPEAGAVPAMEQPDGSWGQQGGDTFVGPPLPKVTLISSGVPNPVLPSADNVLGYVYRFTGKWYAGSDMAYFLSRITSNSTYGDSGTQNPWPTVNAFDRVMSMYNMLVGGVAVTMTPTHVHSRIIANC